VVADGTQLPLADASFDAVTVAFGLRNMESWPGALREMSRVLGPDGNLLVLDFSMPRPPLAAPYRFYLHRVLPRIAALITGNRAGYEYLGESIEEFPSGAAMAGLIRGNGFVEASAMPLAAGIVSIYTARK
jgi:demethylmenaquinone methyltransferase/2-methoxy-6-polyprenyl-1,4-benzoquinol methylase